MQTEARVGVAVEGGVRKLVQPPQQKPQQLGTVSQLLAGGVAGALAKTCTAPLARLTILFQVQGMHSNVATLRKLSIWSEASRIIHEEGFRAFWKGNLVTIAHRLPYSSVNFYAYEHYKKLLKTIPVLQSHTDNVSADLCIQFVGGGLAGITASASTYPLDLVRTRLAAQVRFKYLAFLSYLTFTPLVCLALINCISSLCCTLVTCMQRALCKSERLLPYLEVRLYIFDVNLVLVNLMCNVLNIKLSIADTKIMQTNTTYYSGIFNALQTISKEEGIFGLYKGLGTTLLTVGPSIAISFTVYESMRSYWQSNRPNDSAAVVSLACGSLSGIASSTVKNPSLKTIELLNPRILKELMSVTKRVWCRNCTKYLTRLTPRTRDQVGIVILSLAYENIVQNEGDFGQRKHTTFPLDLVRRRKQLEGAGGRARVYTMGLFGMFRHIIRTEGLRGLYRGILPEYYKVVPGVGICFMTYDTLKKLLADISA
ncbi:hypothetical protein Ahy_A07g032024 isoform A [Arachis hypogaea]|uniref:Uncharacterized protein n=1 Tax=Arachis hypogaea TaxID=3818 RepID=A0A445C5V1_ARAHY|nr:hypothetical protein Ahy_A07g032024 isoform A [Arachis hypogaea]